MVVRIILEGVKSYSTSREIVQYAGLEVSKPCCARVDRVSPSKLIVRGVVHTRARSASCLPLVVEQVRVRGGVRGHGVDGALELHVANLRVLLRGAHVAEHEQNTSVGSGLLWKSWSTTRSTMQC